MNLSANQEDDSEIEVKYRADELCVDLILLCIYTYLIEVQLYWNLHENKHLCCSYVGLLQQ